jgi:hypothetical protein
MMLLYGVLKFGTLLFCINETTDHGKAFIKFITG